MLVKKIKCTTCGGDIAVHSRFAKTVTCRYCHTVYELHNDEIEKTAVTRPLEPLSFFQLGYVGTYQDKRLEVLGRIRLADEEDEWNEWYVLWDAVPHWLEESFDTATLFSQHPISTKLPLFHEVMVGQVIEVNGTSIFITEKGSATVLGTEGEFSGRVKPNDNYDFLQGSSSETAWAVEYTEHSITLLQGTALALAEITHEK
jgi:hypothetical protein